MIGHYLARLTHIEEGRVLTRMMLPHEYAREGDTETGPACLIGAVHGITGRHVRELRSGFVSPAMAFALDDGEKWIGFQYNVLCERFGVERTNVAIRNRVLTNQARRALTSRREAVTT